MAKKTIGLYLVIIIIIVNINQLYSIDKNWFKIDKPNYLTSITGYSSNDQVYSSVTDSDGNYIISGYFEGKMNFGNHTIISNGDKDIFIAKKSSSGNWLWVVNAGGISADYALGINVDLDGNIYATGYFYRTAHFGEYSLNAGNASGIYFASLDANGNWRWAVSAGGNSYDKGFAVATDSNNVYFTGSFQSTAIFGEDTLVSNGMRDIFISKLDFDGNWIKSVHIGSNQNDEAYDIAVTSTGNIVIGGSFREQMYVKDELLISAGNSDAFLAIADSDLNFLSANRAGGSGIDAVLSLTTDGNTVYSTGYFSQNSDFDLIEKASGGGKDIFVAKSNGSAEWLDVATAGSTLDDEGKDIIIDGDDIFVTGYFRSNASFGNDVLISSGDKDVFVASLDNSFEWNNIIKGGGSSMEEPISISKYSGSLIIAGNFINTTTFGNNQNKSIGGLDVFLAELSNDLLQWSSLEHYAGYKDISTVSGLAKDVMGNKYVSGSFYGQLNFGSNILSSEGASDGFLAKIGPAGTYIWVKNIRGSQDIDVKSITVDDELNVYVCGSFSGTVRFGSIQKTSSGLSDIFVAKLNSQGVWQWVETAGNFLFDEALDIVFYDEEHIYITGYYSYSVTFGDDILSGSSDSRIFIASINSEGDWQWAKRAGGNSYDMGYAVAADSSGNCIAVGIFENTAVFGSESVESYGNDDFFISKLSPDGDWLWTRTSGSNTWRDAAYDVAVDNNGRIYVTGQYNNFATFDDRYLISKGDVDAFVIQLDSNGNWGFLLSFGGKGFDSGSGLFYEDGELYMTGTFSDTVTVGSNKYYSYDKKDVFFAKIDTAGSFEWIKTAKGSNDDVAKGVIKDTRGNLHFTGVYTDSLLIGDEILTNNTYVDRNFYIASWGKKTPPHNWNFKSDTEAFAQIIIPDSIHPQINGQDFSTYDAVGIYYDKEGKKIFGGFAHWNNEDLIINVWQDDLNTALTDGFIIDSTYKYELWKYENENTFPVNVHYSEGSNSFQDSGVSVIRYLPRPETDTVYIELNEGWNLISAYIEPFDKDIETIVDDIAQDIAIINDGAKFYIPKYRFKTMDDWNRKKAYKVYAKNISTLSFEGFYFPHISTSLVLNSGWNLIPYPNKQEMSIAVAFESLLEDDNLLIVKDSEGNLFIPALGFNSINQLKSGEGYYIYIKNDTEFIFPFE